MRKNLLLLTLLLFVLSTTAQTAISSRKQTNTIDNSDTDLIPLSISLGTLTLALDSAVTTYDVEVEGEVGSIEIITKPSGEKITLIVGATYEFKMGENTINITVKTGSDTDEDISIIVTVTAEDGTSKVYTFNVTRKPKTNNIEVENSSSAVIYPNPTKGTVYVNTVNNQTSDIKVYSLSGKLLKQAMSNQVDITEFDNGIYLLEANGQMMKVVKE